MSNKKRETLVFFVPGIMGSTLLFHGVGNSGQLVEEEYWSDDIWKSVANLKWHPNRLTSSSLRPDKVISKISCGPLKTVTVYGRLLEFCTNEKGLGLKKDVNFFPFAYNWTEDNIETANTFANFITEKDPKKSSKIKIIAHSMGGIVARLMLLQNPTIADQTDLFFQIASPVKGAAKAFYVLKNSKPRFNNILDEVVKIMVDTKKFGRAIENLASIYQLLPAPKQKCLLHNDGNLYSAFDPNACRNLRGDHIKSAKKVHKRLAKPIKTKIRCVYSDACKTENIYNVDADFEIRHRKKTVYASGDKTVTCSSAFAYTNPEDRVIIREPKFWRFILRPIRFFLKIFKTIIEWINYLLLIIFRPSLGRLISSLISSPIDLAIGIFDIRVTHDSLCKNGRLLKRLKKEFS